MDWQPSASTDVLRVRAGLLATLRAFFAERGILEVDTPLLARHGVTDPAIEPLRAGVTTDAAPLFLQTSPEFFMKRLLASGSGPIYQLGKVFRAAELGARHNPEFTMLEWYRPGFSLEMLAEEVAALVSTCFEAASLPAPVVLHRRYRELFEEVVGIDPHRAGASELAGCARRLTDTGGLALDRDGWLDLLMSHAVEPTLRDQGLVLVSDYPASQAALARCRERDGLQVADRFEAFLDGVEIANGYRELLDADELIERSARDNRRRLDRGQEERELDPLLVAAQRVGLPDCSGVALGVDRLLMQILGADRLQAVLPFAWH